MIKLKAEGIFAGIILLVLFILISIGSFTCDVKNGVPDNYRYSGFHRRTSMNAFGCIICTILFNLIVLPYGICNFIYWITHIGRK